MHRVHDSAAIPTAYDALRRAGFADVSLDLIFSLPDALERDWRNDLERAIANLPNLGRTPLPIQQGTSLVATAFSIGFNVVLEKTLEQLERSLRARSFSHARIPTSSAISW